MNQKVIRINYVGFWDGFDPDAFSITEILKKHYQVEICDNPDYVVCSCIGKFYDYLRFPQVRIMYVGENYIPDLNTIDYAITPYPIEFLDRCFHLPQGLRSLDNNNYCIQRSTGKFVFDHTLLDKKTRFATFCASHESEYGYRGSFFSKLCEYKTVDSIGTYLNNTGLVVKRLDGSKAAYLKSGKFTLCFESTSHGGFNTEKIVDAFCADTIPVYFGDPYIGDIFNKKAFINVGDYQDFNDAIEAIKQLDQDDEKYLAMLNEPVLTDVSFVENLMSDYERFVLHIFEQSPQKAYRRSRVYYANYYESFIKGMTRIYYTPVLQGLLKIKRRKTP